MSGAQGQICIILFRTLFMSRAGKNSVLALFLIVEVALVFMASCSSQQSPVSAKVESTVVTTPSPFRRSLSEDESCGGHTIARHVGKSDDELRARLARERITAASTYTDLLTAEQTVGTAIHREADRVQAWTKRQGRRPNLALDFVGDERHPIGRSMRRDENSSRPCANAVVVLKSDGANGYFVLTSYPECR